MTYPKQQAEAQMIFRKTGGFVQGNMTLRDMFAAKAMQALIWNPDIDLETKADVAEVAYKYADAMLEERIK
jgi:hypothetical protein